VANYCRDEEIKRRVNTFLENAFQLPTDDYYGRLDLKHLLGLKSALSDINNALTLRLTLQFLDWLEIALAFKPEDSKRLRATVFGAKPSANGYDIQCLAPVPLAAEVKCNIPVNGGTKYGAAQRNGILADIDALLNGKSKAAVLTPNALKFMVFMDLPEVRAANEHLLKSSAMQSRAFRMIEAWEEPRNPAVVYGVHIGLVHA
jgi:hypothetical protein